MPKNKLHKGSLKRIRISKTGKVRHKSANLGHYRQSKSGKRLRQLRKDPYMANPDAKRFEKLLFRRLRGRTQPRSALRSNPSPEQRRAAQAEAMAQVSTN
ncbi:MAG: 50S ribosomal protein L35 [Phycisphaeraceae bacterium]|nr:50S ribosomal protein L35 [Phycisphaeraceae bacterium]